MNKYIDIHAHVLPGMGCGPETAAESLAMLRTLHDHGVKTVIATPFFNPETETADAFLARREAAYARLRQAMEGETLPHVALGAEVLLCPAVLECGRIDRFRVERTGYVLVCLPRGQVIDPALMTLFDHFHVASGLVPVLTDIDRYFNTIQVEDMFALSRAGALLQVSCAGIMAHDIRKYALYLLGNHIAQFVSSGYASRQDSPRLVEAMRVLKRSLPLVKYKRIKNNAGMLLSNAAVSELVN